MVALKLDHSRLLGIFLVLLSSVASLPFVASNYWDLPSSLSCNASPSGGLHEFHGDFVKSQIISHAGSILPPKRGDIPPSTNGRDLFPILTEYQEAYVFKMKWRDLKGVQMVLVVTRDPFSAKDHIKIASAWVMVGNRGDPCGIPGQAKRQVESTASAPISLKDLASRLAPFSNLPTLSISKDAVWNLPQQLVCSSAPDGNAHTYHGPFLQSQITVDARFIIPAPSESVSNVYLYTLRWQDLKDVAIYLTAAIEQSDKKQHIRVYRAEVPSTGDRCYAF